MLSAFTITSVGCNYLQQYDIHNTQHTLCCSEMAPPHLRGRFNQLYQIILTLFILVAQVINLIINLTDAVRWGWRLSLGFAFVPSTVLFLGGVFLPDSPNSLLERGHLELVSPATNIWHVICTPVASIRRSIVYTQWLPLSRHILFWFQACYQIDTLPNWDSVHGPNPPRL